MGRLSIIYPPAPCCRSRQRLSGVNSKASRHTLPLRVRLAALGDTLRVNSELLRQAGLAIHERGDGPRGTSDGICWSLIVRAGNKERQPLNKKTGCVPILFGPMFALWPASLHHASYFRWYRTRQLCQGMCSSDMRSMNRRRDHHR